MAAVLFVGLNIFDALLTKTSLAMGAAELNPIAVSFGSSILFKALLAIAIIVPLYYFGRERLLWLVNFGLLGIVVWNLQILGMLNLSPL